ncbi:E3 ubiquitin-protein ligase ATL6-like [Humulus lupulus]|uniref:E3 ubiquitin-protein ligase ATL6-like n=1 Tax=Humulus lupulus TaxID=3486 RepID=UPI002B4181BE|nr:E3 ubiquitin-protein ligase ATL6-like [Humulus lupulus]
MMTNSNFRLSKREMKAILFVLLLLLAALSYNGAQSPGNPQNNTNGYNPWGLPTAYNIAYAMFGLLAIMFLGLFFAYCCCGCRCGGGGLDAAVLETFPTLEYSEAMRLQIGRGEELNCGVCLFEFKDHEMLRFIPNCNHVFHAHCIDKWLKSHTDCPLCRVDLVHGANVPLHRPEFPNETEMESQSNAAAVEPTVQERAQEQLPALVPATVSDDSIRSRISGFRSRMTQRFLRRSQSTGYSFFRAGENTERFTLRLSAEVRNNILNRQLERTSSQVVLPRESSSRHVDRGGGEGTSRSGPTTSSNS